MLSSAYSYIQLTKPRIVMLVLLTGAVSLVLEGSLVGDSAGFILVLLGLYLVSGSANGLNQYFERGIDSLMSRTCGKRPLPLGRITPASALVFSITLGAAGVALFSIVFNLLSAVLALATVLFYGLFYTLYLKPRTDLNIVIGGAAGAMAPVIAWSAAAGNIALLPLMLSLVIFFWTPPHFWALALYFRQDYEKSGLPMLPVTGGRERTGQMIIRYSFLLVAASLVLGAFTPGVVYFTAAVLLGGIFLIKAFQLRKHTEPVFEKAMFVYSIVYLNLLFVAMVVEEIL